MLKTKTTDANGWLLSFDDRLSRLPDWGMKYDCIDRHWQMFGGCDLWETFSTRIVSVDTAQKKNTACLCTYDSGNITCNLFHWDNVGKKNKNACQSYRYWNIEAKIWQHPSSFKSTLRNCVGESQSKGTAKITHPLPQCLHIE